MDFGAARVIAAAHAVDGAGLRGELTLELAVDWSPELRRGRRLQAPFAASENHVETAVLLPLYRVFMPRSPARATDCNVARLRWTHQLETIARRPRAPRTRAPTPLRSRH